MLRLYWDARSAKRQNYGKIFWTSEKKKEENMKMRIFCYDWPLVSYSCSFPPWKKKKSCSIPTLIKDAICCHTPFTAERPSTGQNVAVLCVQFFRFSQEKNWQELSCVPLSCLLCVCCCKQLQNYVIATALNLFLKKVGILKAGKLCNRNCANSFFLKSGNFESCKIM